MLTAYKRCHWFNSDFHSGFLLNDNQKITEISFDVNPFQINVNNNLKVITYIRDHNQSRPIQIKLKLPYNQSREVFNDDNEAFPIIYSNHTGVEGMSTYYPYSIARLVPQQIPRFTFRVDDNYNKSNYSYYFTSVTNGTLLRIANDDNGKYLLFNSSGSFVLDKNLVCDILVVGGGGGGGSFGGGGGAGQVLYTTNFNLTSGTYTITVGAGGAGSSTSTANGSDGSDSSIVISGVTYTAKGGGGGGTRRSDAGAVGRAGNDGGSGGGGSHSDTVTAINVGGVSNKTTYTNWISLGNNGGDGKDGDTANGYGHAGGGGAGGVGGNGLVNGGGNGGFAINLSSIFTNAIGQGGWFGGGGGGTGFNGTGGTIGYGNGGNGNLGGGGNGGINANGVNGLANTGGGGGGGDLSKTGGTGGSGVVIIKFTERRIEGITPEETLIQATNANIPITIDSQYQINYQTPVVLPKGTYETILNNGAITFKSKPDYSYPTTSNFPIVWYKFDTNGLLLDSSGNNYNLTNSSTPATLNTTTFIKGNASADLTPTNSVLTSTIPSLVGKDWSFSGWVYIIHNAGRTYNVICSFGGQVYGVPHKKVVIYAYRNSSTSMYYSVGYYTGLDQNTTNFNDFSNWVHISVTYKYSTVAGERITKFYRNGVEISLTNSPRTDNYSGNTTFEVGRNSTEYINAYFDDFRIHNYILSPVEVYDLYNGNSDRSYPILKDANGATINPIFWYQFDNINNIGIDSSGNGYHLTTNNGGATINPNDYNKGSGCLSLSSASSQYLERPAASGYNIGQTNFTISVWSKRVSNTAGSRYMFANGSGASPNSECTLGYENDTIRFAFWADDCDTTETFLNAGTWVHIAATATFGATNATQRIYVNGVLKQTRTSSGKLTTNGMISVGKINNPAAVNFFNGLIDDVRVYTTDLTQTQIAELYNGRLAIYNPPGFILGTEIEPE